MSEEAIFFKDWLPDTPDFGKDALTEADGVLRYDGSYKPYSPLLGIGGITTPALPIGAIYPSGVSGASTFYDEIHVGFSTSLYVYNGIGAITNRSLSTYSSAVNWSFAQFDDIVIATNGLNAPQRRTLGSAGNYLNLAATGAAPPAYVVGVVNRFAMLGNLGPGGESWVQWSSIDDPTDWPTLGSATAVARQSGLQELPQELGRVNGIFGGDQVAILMQDGGISRAQYVGGDVVFQFDTISKSHGAAYGRGSIQINGLVYFISNRGFCVTDGVTVQPIGDRKIDRYFLSNFDSTYASRLSVAHDAQKKLILWGWTDTTATAGQPNRILAFNYEEQGWTKAPQLHEVLFTPPVSPNIGPFGFVPTGTTTMLARFLNTPLTATLISAEAEFNPGGISRVKGVRPLVTGATSAFVGIVLGTRMNQYDSVTYGATSGPNSNGRCDFRSESRFHRAKLLISGSFTQAIGLQYEVEPSGSR